MSEAAAGMIWLGLGAYLGFGLVLGIGVLMFARGRLHASAAGMPIGVRLLVLPGMAALWPVVLLRLAGVRPPEDRT